ncbi:Abi family protein [Microtetraspora fusca]|uniref:Abi family protein n=1 Tax=Microtetraspora fusca TaxID=1997 RepID=A0ABW6V358_MICFU|nr:Abi family protein [Microtetraspora fusca]
MYVPLETALQVALSPERLTSYLNASRGDLPSALRLYAWNIEISAALLGPLHCLEITLRNAIDRELTDLYERRDWWDSPSARFDAITTSKIRDAKSLAEQGRSRVVPGHVIAELSFGFWVTLLGGHNGYEERLWRPALHRVFPGYRGLRKPLHVNLYHLRKLRNRIAHHEPVHQRHLTADHASILRMLDLLSADIADWARLNDRVPEVLARRRDVCAAAVPTRF